MKSAWEEGIAEALGLVRTLGRAASCPRPPLAKPLAPSQAAVLEQLRAEGGAISGTIATLAAKLSLPPSTLSGALRVLGERGLIVRDGRSLRLAERKL